MDYKLIGGGIYKLLVGSGYDLVVGQDAPVGTGVIKRWNGTEWVVASSIRHREASAWSGDKTVKYYNGSGWVQVN